MVELTRLDVKIATQQAQLKDARERFGIDEKESTSGSGSQSFRRAKQIFGITRRERDLQQLREQRAEINEKLHALILE